MKRFIEYNPDQNYLISLIPEETFSKDSFEIFLIDMLGRIVDENKFYSKEEDRGGAAAHNPKAILGILFYSFSKGVFSYRKMARNCHFDISYIYLSGYSTPDHSTISRFVSNFANHILDLFSLILYVAIDKGYVDYKLSATDGTKLKANASKGFSGTLEDFEKRKEKIQEKIKTLIEKCKQAEKKEDVTKIEEQIEEYEKLNSKLDDFLQNAQKIKKANGKEAKQNITDPDARIMRMNSKQFNPGYNAQATVCAKNGIVIAADVTDEANDIHQLQPMLELSEELAPEEKKANFKNGKHLADNGYHSTANIVYADKNNLDVYIAPETAKKIYQDPSKEDEKKSIGIENCEIKKNGDKKYIICPGGLILIKYYKKTIRGEEYYQFNVDIREKCHDCKFYTQCCGKINKEIKGFSIKADLMDNWELVKSHREKVYSERGKEIYKKRMGAIEKVFGHIKENLGFKSMLVRGKEKVKAIWQMICISYNLTRIHNLNIKANH